MIRNRRKSFVAAQTKLVGTTSTLELDENEEFGASQMVRSLSPPPQPPLPKRRRQSARLAGNIAPIPAPIRNRRDRHVSFAGVVNSPRQQQQRLSSTQEEEEEEELSDDYDHNIVVGDANDDDSIDGNDVMEQADDGYSTTGTTDTTEANGNQNFVNNSGKFYYSMIHFHSF